MAPTQTRLAELECVIEAGLQTFVEVGRALLEIREGRLYRDAGFNAFEDYCRERWGWSRIHAHRHIDAARVADNLLPTGNVPASERQARELAKLEPEQQREVAEAIAQDGDTFEDYTASEISAVVESVKTGAPANLAVHFSSESEEWYTPLEIIEAVRATLGEIDLDPCSDAGANVSALRRFTKAEDGLSEVWTGRVYMNPPYGRGIGEWVEKLCSEYGGGNVTEAVALVPARTDTEWFRMFGDFAICFVEGRLKFSGHENSAPFPSALIYLGQNVPRFAGACQSLGSVWVKFRV